MDGQRLKQLRNEKKLTQKQLGNLVNLSQQTIGHYEVNRAQPNAKTIELFADIFNTTTDYLIGLSDTPHQHTKNDIDPLSELPEIARKEIADFTEFVQQKYKGWKEEK